MPHSEDDGAAALRRRSKDQTGEGRGNASALSASGADTERRWRRQVRRTPVRSRGDYNQGGCPIVHARGVLRPAVVPSAAATVLVRDSPSAHPEPSEEDVSVTKQLV